MNDYELNDSDLENISAGMGKSSSTKKEDSHKKGTASSCGTASVGSCGGASVSSGC